MKVQNCCQSYTTLNAKSGENKLTFFRPAENTQAAQVQAWSRSVSMDNVTKQNYFKYVLRSTSCSDTTSTSLKTVKNRKINK